MTTLKELLKNLGLDIQLPKVMEEYEIFPTHPYTEYHTEKTDEGEIIVFTGSSKFSGHYDMEGILLGHKEFLECFIKDDGSRFVISSVDNEGNTPIY